MNKRITIYREDEPQLTTCPWSYHTCKLPAGETCKVKGKINGAKDITEWTKAAQKALDCKHLGAILTKSQYEHRRLGVSV